MKKKRKIHKIRIQYVHLVKYHYYVSGKSIQNLLVMHAPNETIYKQINTGGN